MTEARRAMETFVAYAARLIGDEKGEAQVFCDRLFQAFGHGGYKEAGATLESRQKRTKSTAFIDLLWKPRLLLEMKKRGEKLQRHYSQAFDYWLDAVPHRPRYVVLCNFDELWVYDFDLQLNEPVDKVAVTALPERYEALNFLFPVEQRPVFRNNLIDVTRTAADKVATAFNSLVGRGEDRPRAQRFMLQSVVALFSEDAELLQPKGLFSELLRDCRRGGSTYDLVGGLFRQMNQEKPARGGRYAKVKYFNGGLFAAVEPVELNTHEIDLLLAAAEENWSRVQPPIFGTLFENSLDKGERHALGAHYTSEADIQKVVLPTIVRPWRERISAARTLTQLKQLIDELRQFHVLDPACGSGNFLYVAYRELVRLELEVMARVHTEFSRKEAERVGTRTGVTTRQFHGIELNRFGVELAKVTLMLAKELALNEAEKYVHERQGELPFEFDPALPLDNLDQNIVVGDALLCPWPKVHAIIGNPPYQSKNKALAELGAAYLADLRGRYPGVPGRADYCVYWFRKAHDELEAGGRAGLVGTNTIRQNYSREGGLDHIVNNGGTITEAVSTQVWAGDAVVHVSIVNWLKGEQAGKKVLFEQMGDAVDSPWERTEVDVISSALSAAVDVTKAKPILANVDSGLCYQGQTHGHDGFLLTPQEAHALMRAAPDDGAVIHPYLIGEDVLTMHAPSRFVIDLNNCDSVIEVMRHKAIFARLSETVLPVMKANAEEERRKSGREVGPRQSHYKKWWKHWRGRPELIGVLGALTRYIVCVRVTKRPIFEFVSTKVRPNDALQVFPAADDYSYGILQSNVHWQWFNERCSTFKRDFRYTSNTVFDSFCWPQSPTERQVAAIAVLSRQLRSVRAKLMMDNGIGLRELYRTLDVPGANPLRAAQLALDEAVRAVYGLGKRDDPLRFFLALNEEVAAKEAGRVAVVGPGLPSSIKDPSQYMSDDCIKPL